MGNLRVQRRFCSEYGEAYAKTGSYYINQNHIQKDARVFALFYSRAVPLPRRVRSNRPCGM